jgi:hypothetical protein
MTKEEFLENENVVGFIDFFTEKWFEEFNFNLMRKVNGNHRPAISLPILSIKDAKENYLWPYSVINNHSDNNFNRKGTTYEQSNTVLNYAKSLLLNQMGLLEDENSLKNGTGIILEWGGVFKKGNRLKVIDQNYSLTRDYNEVKQKWSNINTNINFDLNDSFNFVSNAGFTKVYSVLLNDFIIYDSRVAVAIAYLLDKYFDGQIPEILKIFIPPSYGNENTILRRRVNNAFKSTNSSSKKHFYSNVIANLIIKKAVDKISENDNEINLREIEAALFMIGYDIRN